MTGSRKITRLFVIAYYIEIDINTRINFCKQDYELPIQMKSV